MSRIINHIGSFFPKLQKDFKVYDGDIFSEVYDGDFLEYIPFDKIFIELFCVVNFNNRNNTD